MRFSTAFTTAAFLMFGLSTVTAETFTVMVGKDASLLYEPTSVKAKAGDIVSFKFMAKNHTVTQSTFDKPCEPKADGVDSGYQLIPGGTTVFPEWSISITNDTAPIWFYCAQGPHCQLGMVFAVNPNDDKTFEMFHANALATAPPAASGGASSGYGGAAGGGMGGGYGGSAPSGTVPTSTPPVAVVTPEGTAAPANAGSLPQSQGNGAVTRALGWPVLLGSVVMGVLVL